MRAAARPYDPPHMTRLAPRSALLAAAVLLALTWGTWLRHADPRIVLLDDLGREHVPKMAWVYAHPWSAYGPKAPLYNLGTADFHRDADHTLPLVAPALVAVLGRLAPGDPVALALFEWRLTGVLLLGALAGVYGLLRREGVAPPLALAGAATYVASAPLFGEWSHTPFFRALLLVPVAVLALRAATTTGGWIAWSTAALAVVASAAQTVTCFVAAGLPFAFCAATALVERSRLRAALGSGHATVTRVLLPPLGALAVAVALLAPAYHQTAEALAASAHTARLATDDVHFLKYAMVGADWIRPGEVVQWWWGGPFLLAGLALLAASRGAVPLSALARVGLVLGGAGLVLLAVSAATLRLLGYEEGRVVFAGMPVRPPAALALLVRTPTRSWLVFAHLGLALAAFAHVDAWTKADLGAALRRRHAWAAGALVGVAAGLGGVLSAVPVASAGVTVILGAAVLAALLRPRLGPWLVTGIASLCAVAAAHAFLQERAAFIPNGERLGEAHRALASASLPDLRGRYDHRVMVLARDLENACFVLDASCAGGYPARSMPREPVRFLEDAGVAHARELPYLVSFDAPQLQATGLADLLGIRFWLLDSGPGRPLGRGPGGDLVLVETPSAFPRAWPLLVRHEVATWPEAVRLVLELGRTGRLRREGVVPPGLGALPAGPEPPRVVVRAVRAGSILLHTASQHPFVVATNEFHAAGWRLVSGRTALPTVAVNAAFLGGLVPGGEHEVHFVEGGTP